MCTRPRPNATLAGCRDRGGLLPLGWPRWEVLQVLEVLASVQAHQAAGDDQVESIKVW